MQVRLVFNGEERLFWERAEWERLGSGIGRSLLRLERPGLHKQLHFELLFNHGAGFPQREGS